MTDIEKGTVILNGIYVKLFAEAAVEQVRAYSKNQVELWKQVPGWALEADGRNGYSPQKAQAYEQKIWSVEGSIAGGSLFVDLNNGKIVRYDLRTRSISCNLIEAEDSLVLPFALHLDALNADKIIERLKKEILADEIAFPNRRTDKMRESIRKRLGLKPVAI